jgi:hypothetical protein
MIKTKIQKKEKIIVQTIENVQINSIQFNHDSGSFSVILDLLSENNDLINRKMFTYQSDEFDKLFDRLIRRIFKDDDLKLLNE